MCDEPAEKECGKCASGRGCREGARCGLYLSLFKPLSQCWLFLGESNMNYNKDLYNCTFPELIEDWRHSFHQGSQGQTERFFPFGFVQVCVPRGRNDQHPSGYFVSSRCAGQQWNARFRSSQLSDPRGEFSRKCLRIASCNF